MSRARRLIGSVGGIGLLPGAPGTWASAATVAAWALLFGMRGWEAAPLAGGWSALHASPWVARVAVAVPLLVLFVVGVKVGDHAPADWGASDPGSFVLDEVVGQGLALLPLLPGPLSWPGALLAFALFRLFDITKPPPCRRLESLHGGTGIMTDDVAAGAYACAIVAIVHTAGWLPA